MKKRKPSSPSDFTKEDRKRKLDFKRKKEEQLFKTKGKPKKIKFRDDDFE
jgi:hypothetical protein